MAKVVKSLTVEVTPKLTVDRETADVCLSLVNWFLDAHKGMRLERLFDEDGVRWVITSGPTEPVTLKTTMDNLSATAKAAVDAADAEMQRKKWRKLAGLEGE